MNDQPSPAEAPAVPHFTDACGRTWKLQLNVRLAQQIRDDLGVDFLKAHDGKSLAALGDVEKLVQVLWMLCEAQAVQQGVSPEDFAAGLMGEQLEAADRGIEEMLVLFTQPAQRPVMEAMLKRAKEVKTKAADLAVRKVTGPSVDRRIKEELDKAGERFDQALSTSSSSPTSGRRSPASETPGHTA